MMHRNRIYWPLDSISKVIRPMLVMAEQKITRWLWLQAGQKKEVLFKELTAPNVGTHELRCGNITKSLRAE